MPVNPQHKYSNEAEKANKDIYDDIKLKRSLRFLWLIAHTLWNMLVMDFDSCVSQPRPITSSGRELLICMCLNRGIGPTFANLDV